MFKNIEGFSAALFDKELIVNKRQFTYTEKAKVVDEMLAKTDSPENRTKMLFAATDRILYAQRNLKLMLFMTTGPFFFVFYLFKKSIQLALLYFFYNKKGGNKSKEQPTKEKSFALKQ